MEHVSAFRLIIGLGNPGQRYRQTRHNAGFLVLDELADRAGETFRLESKWRAEMARWGQSMLMKPQTYMNLSGESTGSYARYHGIAPEEILVVLDDIALPLGDLRLRKSGSAGGHNGLESIIQHHGTNAIARLRVGIGAASGVLTDHVLGNFALDELPALKITLGRSADAVEHASIKGLDSAMNIFNQRTTV